MSMGQALFFQEKFMAKHNICCPFENSAQNRSTHFDDGDHLRLTHCGGKNVKNDDVSIFRRASGVKRPEMTPKTGFSCLKSDLHQILGQKAILRERKVILNSGVAREMLSECSAGALGIKTASKMAPEVNFLGFFHYFVKI